MRETSFPSGRPTAIKLSRHFGRDAENHTMDGNQSVVQMLESGNMPTRRFMFAVAKDICRGPSLPSLALGFRHPGRNDGVPTLVYNDEVDKGGKSSFFKSSQELPCTF